MGNSGGKLGKVDTGTSPHLVQKWIDFYVKETRTIYSLIKSPVPCAEEVFDSICVLTAPTEDLRVQAVIVGEKLMHSFVLLLNSRSGQGLRVEYLADNFGKVLISHGSLAKMDERNGIGFQSDIRCLQEMSLGFYRCNITMEKLLEFNALYEKLCDFDITDHNCHIFHRSLLATALKGEFLYNVVDFTDDTANMLTKKTIEATSQIYHLLGGDFSTKSSILESIKKQYTNTSNRFTSSKRSSGSGSTGYYYNICLQDLIKCESSAISVKAVLYNPKIHKKLPLGNVSYSDASNLSRAFFKFESALKEGNVSHLLAAVTDCRQFKLYALADLGDVLIKILNELETAQQQKIPRLIMELMDSIHSLVNKFAVVGIDNDLKSFDVVLTSSEYLQEIEYDKISLQKAFYNALNHGNVEVLKFCTSRLIAYGITKEADRGTKVLGCIDALSLALESKSLHRIQSTCDQFNHEPDIVNFLEYKKCLMIINENEKNQIFIMKRKKQRNVFLIVLLIVVILFWFRDLWFE